MPEVPLDRHRPPPDVARRLTALATPRPPGAPLRDAADAGAGGTADRPVAHVGERAATLRTRTAAWPSPHGWTPVPPARAQVPPDLSAQDLPEADGAPDAGPAWLPDVVSALADAAAASPPVPAPVPRVRWAPSWRAAGAAVVVLALVAGGITLRAAAAPRGEPVLIPTPAPGGASTEPGGTGDDAVVVVHVVGAVTTPGVVRLDLGSRVADAVAAAGGSTPDADLGTVNLARVVTDGEQLVVPVVGAPAPEVAGVPTDGLVDLNAAPAATLEELPGVGPVLAGRIVQRRTERPFTTVDELDEVVGIGPALLADLRPRVRV